VVAIKILRVKRYHPHRRFVYALIQPPKRVGGGNAAQKRGINVREEKSYVGPKKQLIATKKKKALSLLLFAFFSPTTSPHPLHIFHSALPTHTRNSAYYVSHRYRICGRGVLLQSKNGTYTGVKLGI
jgi:hypothetical protein